MANRKVTGPHGTYELIVTKALEMPKWKRNATADPGPDWGQGPTYTESTRVDDQIRFRNIERTSFSYALSSYIVDWFATLRSNRRVTGVRIRAVNWEPPAESFVWTTTPDSADRVLEEIVEGLTQGKIVQPEGAVFGGDENYSGQVDPINALRSSGADAYELVDQLPRGPARAAAWNAYVFQTYGDKLIAATGRKGLPSATYAVVAESFSLSNSWLQRASALAADPAATADVEADAELPCFHTPIRSQEQLIGMREAAEALRIYVAFDLQGLSADAALIDEFRQQLAEIDEQMERAAMLWVEHSPPELLGGVGDAMLKALAQVQTLGQLLARTQP